MLLLYSPAIYKTADVIQTYVYRRGLIGVQFSYATAINMGVEVDITTKAGWPSDGVAQVTNAVLKAFTGFTSTDPELLQDFVGTGLTIGDDVEVLYLGCAIKTVPGMELTGPGQHFNSFPLTPNPLAQNGGAPIWHHCSRRFWMSSRT